MVQTAVINDYTVQRDDEGGLLIVTAGGVDPTFDADQLEELLDFIDDSEPPKPKKKAAAKAGAEDK